MGVRNLAPKQVGRKEYLMEMPAILKGDSLTRLAQGAFAGALATMIIGFSWGGWVTGKTADTNATMLVNAALVQAYGPVCIERFKQQPNVEAKWVELTKLESWRRDNYIKESGFATPPGATSPNSAVADSCAEALSKVIAMQAPAAK
jgi:pimeloyl-ACP methyl ester carboxylesterase